MGPNLLNVAGLAFDMAGASLLAWALVFTRGQILKAQSLTVFNGNPVLHMALRRQRLDACFGLGMLLFGFLLQMIAAIGLSCELAYWYIPAGLLIAVLAAHQFARLRLQRSDLGQQEARMLTANAKHLGE